MVLAAAFLLLFAGLGLAIAGQIPFKKDRVIGARFGRSAGVVLAFAFPLAVILFLLWQRYPAWEAQTPLLQAQLIAFGTLFVVGVGVLIWGYIASAPKLVRTPAKPTVPEPDDVDLNDVVSDDADATPPPAKKQPRRSEGTPFDFE